MAHDLTAPCDLTPATPGHLDQVRAFEAQLAALPQVAIDTHHVIHAGMYARTIRIPAGVALTGAEIKRDTVLVVSGHVRVSGDGGPRELQGYHVLTAAAGRKQAFLALADTDLTMIFPTQSRTTEDCEREFTDEADSLMSRTGRNTVVITGARPCPVQ